MIAALIKSARRRWWIWKIRRTALRLMRDMTSAGVPASLAKDTVLAMLELEAKRREARL